MDDPSNIPNDAEGPPTPSANPFGSDSAGGPPGDRIIDETADPAIRSYAMWIHLGTLIGTVVAFVGQGIPFFVPPLVALIMWLSRKADHPFIDDHGREAMNFQISLIIIYVLLVVVTLLTCGVGIVLIFALGILNVVALILAAIAANKGQIYRYPVCIRMIGPPKPAA
ncbi:MAG: DUF4870 domain-containing protein [Planctomycetota bacterium]